MNPQPHQLTQLSLSILLSLALWSAWTTLPAYAQGPTVTTTEPISNTNNVTSTTNITVTFDTAIDSATVNTQTLTIRGEQTGIYAGSYSFPAGNTVSIDPSNQFKPGEVVRVVASSQIESSGSSPATPYQWQFTVTSQDGPGTGDVWQEQTIGGGFSGAVSVTAADMDGDGDLDVLGAAEGADAIAWWENDGSQAFTKHTITGSFSGASSVTAADVDGDGDLDVLGAADVADEIAWWENDGSQTFTKQTIAGSVSGASSITAADMDGDGDLDVLGAAAGADEIVWWENDGSQNFTERTIAGSFDGASSVYAADVDSDGDLDVLGAAEIANDIAWWENDGSQNFTKHIIAGSFSGASSVTAADVDGDGDLDVLGAASSDNQITWWENDGSQNFTKHNIAGSFRVPYSVYAADVDGDGDLDVLGAAYNDDDITWWENDGSQNFTEHTIAGSLIEAYSVYAADVDGDGDLDVLGAAGSGDITVWYNVAPEMAVVGNGAEISNGDTSPSTTDDTDFGNVTLGQTLTHTFTISSSGLDDLSLSGSPAITLSNSTAFTVTQPAATTLASGETTIFTLTFDPPSEGSFTDTVTIANNDADENPYTFVVQGASSGGQVQAVYPVENSLNVTATSTISLTYDADIAAGSLSTTSVTVRGEQTGIYSGGYSLPASDTILITPTSPFKAGEVVRVVASSQVENTAAITTTPYQWQFTATSQDGAGTGDLWQEQTIAAGFNGASSVIAADMDSDGDLDVLGAAEGADAIAWWENDGSQAFTKHTITGSFNGAEAVSAADVDGDGDLDVLGAAYYADDITWWENNGSQVFTEHTIAGSFDGAAAVTAADMDGDGDLDVLGAADIADAITWWENNGSQTFSEHTIANSFDGARSVYAADVDGDGDLDVLGAAVNDDAITWWENDGSQTFSEHTIAGSFDGARSVAAADVDGDGDLDVLGAAVNDDAITWWENDGSQTFSEHTIAGSFDGARSVAAADVDGDGDLDVLGMAGNVDEIAWWENDGSQTFTEQTIDGTFDAAQAVNTADVDGDGDVDVLGVAYFDDEITVWYNTAPEIAVVGNGAEISNGDTSPTTADDTDFGTLILGQTLTHTFTISSGNTGFGDDLILSGSPTITLTNSTYFSLTQPAATTLAPGETTTFTLTFDPQSVGTFTDTVTIASNDADENPTTFVVQGKGSGGQVQAVYPVENSLNVTSTSSISLTYNTDIAAGSVSTTSVTVRGEQTGIYSGGYSLPEADTILITPTSPFKAGEVVRVVASAQVENTAAITTTPYQWQFTATSQDGPGSGEQWKDQTIIGNYDGASSVRAGDMDGDGDLDLVTTADTGDDLSWWENDGSQSFSQHTIYGFNGANATFVTDMDHDGDLDIVGSSRWEGIQWWENDGSQSFSQHIIKNTFDDAQSVFAIDLDGDGDEDVLGAAQTDDDITWWENDGSQNFTEHTIKGNFNGATSVSAADMDGDGDEDVLGAADTDNEITWWENDGGQNFTEHPIAGGFNGAKSVYATDLDGDGDLDVLGAAQTADDITWWENDGSQNFSEHTIDDNFDGAYSVYAADVDGDGDLDVLGAASIDDDVVWWQNDGAQNFSKQVIDKSFNGALSVYTADMDDDGDMDVLGAAGTAKDIAIWYNIAPEMAVLGNSVEITNGDTSPTTAADTDFGTVTFGQTLTHTFTISSNGTSATDDLILSGSPTITLSNSIAFTVTQPAATTLAPGQTTTFTLTFDPPSEGSFTDTVTILNNDADENPYAFVVEGTGATPEIDVQANGQSIANGDDTPATADDTDFATLTIGQSLIHTFTISNSGIGDLTLSGSPAITLTDGSAFTVTQPASTTIAAGEITTFTLTFDPQSAGTFTDTVTISNNDTDENPTTFVVSGAGDCPGSPIYVNQNAGGSNTGDSWVNAFTDLQDGLSLAQSCSPIEVWVATGVYTPGLNQSDTFTLTSGVAVYGGFAGSETLRSQRNYTDNLTILSGDIDGDDTTDADSVVTDTATISGTNSYHAVWADGVNGDPITATTVLDGFTITAGYANGEPELICVPGAGCWYGASTDQNGGGFYCNGAGSECSPSLSNVTFSGNATGSYGSGGALYNYGGSGISSPSLSNVTFSGNTAGSDGGAMYNYGDSGISSPSLSNVTFSGNATGDYGSGGALYNYGHSGTSSPSLSNVTFSGNSAGNDGGAVYNNGFNYGLSSPSLSNVTFSGNSAGNDGGAVYNNGYPDGASSPSLSNVTFSGNTAGSNGGGIYNNGRSDGASNPSLSNITFSGNTAGSDGGAMYNYAFYGTSNPTLSNVTFSGNTANSAGGGIYNNGRNGTSSPSLTNVILWDNRAATNGDELYDYFASPIISYTLIQSDTGDIYNDSGASITYGPTILTGDPLFVDTAGADGITGTLDDDLRLLPGSPAIDSGDNASAPDEDIAGVSRPVNSVVDMGAYESQGFSLSITGGNNQSTLIDTAFAEPLEVTISSAAAEPVGPGGVISFTAPSSGAGVTTSTLTAATNAGGVASVTVTANSTTGSYLVEAAANGVADPANFTLTNTSYITLSLAKSVDLLTSPAEPGDPLTYTLVISNSGNEDAASVTVADTLPLGVDGQDLNWTGIVTAGEALTFTIAATVTDEAGYGAIVLNTATYSHTAGSGSDSAGFSIIADTTAPTFTTTALMTPTGEITNARPTFDWADAVDAETGVVSYTLLITDSRGSVQEIQTTASTYTPSADLATGVYTWTVRAYDGVGNASDYVSPAATFTIEGETTSLYFPLLLKAVAGGPDLVIDDLVASGSHITVTLRNAGDQTVSDAFWVDVYFNPSQTPGLNQPWDTIAPAGAVWGVTKSLAPGESLSLTVGDAYYFGPPDSSATFPAGATVYAYVDSVNYNTSYGNVKEGNESNNLSAPVISTAGDSAATAQDITAPASRAGLPER